MNVWVQTQYLQKWAENRSESGYATDNVVTLGVFIDYKCVYWIIEQEKLQLITWKIEENDIQ